MLASEQQQLEYAQILKTHDELTYFDKVKKLIGITPIEKRALNRIVKVNDPIFNKQYRYTKNQISTSQYTWYNFLFLNLFFQFHKAANLYFLVQLILSTIPQIAAFNPVSTALPFFIVLCLTAIKDFYDDFQRHKNDREVNSRKSLKLIDGTESEYEKIAWEDIKAGDIIKVNKNEGCPCDIIILKTSSPDNSVFVDTADLDGESNLKAYYINNGVFEEINNNDSAIQHCDAVVECEAPNTALENFTGKIHINGKTIPLNHKCVLLRGMVLRNTDFVVGTVVYAGHQSKLMMNCSKFVFKRTHIDTKLDIIILCIITLLLFCSLVSAYLAGVWARDNDNVIAYLPYDKGIDTPFKISMIGIFTFFILYNTLVPISLYVTIEFIRLGQSLFINWDIEMYDLKTNQPAMARTTTLSEELGQIEYIFSDKTGTLTQNIMTFVQCSIAGNIYGNLATDPVMDYTPSNLPSRLNSISTRQGSISKNIINNHNTDGAMDNIEEEDEGADNDFERELHLDSSNKSSMRRQGSFVIGDAADFVPNITSTSNASTQRTSGLKNNLYKQDNNNNNYGSPKNQSEMAAKFYDQPKGYSPLLNNAANLVQHNNNADGQCINQVDFSDNPYFDSNFSFSDQRLYDKCKVGDAQIIDFFKILALCQEVHIDEDNDSVDSGDMQDGQGFLAPRSTAADSIGHQSSKVNIDKTKFKYTGQSPDEVALVTAAKQFGIVFKGMFQNKLKYSVNGAEFSASLLEVLEFNSDRKRMSVIIKDDVTNEINIYCKGADNIILPRLSKKSAAVNSSAASHLTQFSSGGLRTLCIVKRILSDKEYFEWHNGYEAALNDSSADRDVNIGLQMEKIEKEFDLVGMTAIEDKLQEGVPDTIEVLHQTKIKLIVLTGDKPETAENIGFSCKLLNDKMEIIRFLITRDAATTTALENAYGEELVLLKTKIDDQDRQRTHEMIYNLLSQYEGNLGQDMDDDYYECDDIVKIESDLGIIVDGQSLIYAIEGEVADAFVKLISLSKSVICCRVSPSQKAGVVKLIQDKTGAITLAIGDGANDVSMIKQAHIGVGISGLEGRQAVLASDFSFSQFRFLKRLILVHGRWSYMRMAKFLKYFFYKNFTLTFCQFWFGLFSGWSGASLYDTWFISFYNVIFTCFPVFAMGLLEQDVNERYSLQHPRLYLAGKGIQDSFGIKGHLFNAKEFGFSLLGGWTHGMLLFLITYGISADRVYSKDGHMTDVQFFGSAVQASLVVVVNLVIAFQLYHWTFIHHMFIWGSIISYFVFASWMYEIYYLIPAETFFGIFFVSISSSLWWFTVIFCIFVCMFPVIFFIYIFQSYLPSESDKIRRKVKAGKKHKRSSVLTSTMSDSSVPMKLFSTQDNFDQHTN